MTYTSFDGAAFRAFRDFPRIGPIQMLNLVRFRAWADYGDERQVSGAEAYAAYGRESAPVFARVGGRILWRGSPEYMLIGPADEAWDIAFVAEYPDVAGFVEMIKDPAYRLAMVHRQAGVADSRLLRCGPLDSGAEFGG